MKFRLRAAGYHGPDLFGPEALKIIAEASEGLTRRINIYADKTLLAAFAAGTHTVTADHARAAIADTQIVVDTPRVVAPPRPGRAPRASLVGLALGFVVGAARRLRPAHGPRPRPLRRRAPPRRRIRRRRDGAARGRHAPVAAPAAADRRPPQPPRRHAPCPTAAVRRPPSRDSPRRPWRRQPRGRRRSGRARLAAGRELARQPLARLALTRCSSWSPTRASARTSRPTSPRPAARVEPENALPGARGHAPRSPRIGVLYGAFRERGEADRGARRAARSLRQFRPYVRSLDAVRDDARRAAAPLSALRRTFAPGFPACKQRGISVAFRPRKRYKVVQERFFP